MAKYGVISLSSVVYLCYDSPSWAICAIVRSTAGQVGQLMIRLSRLSGHGCCQYSPKRIVYTAQHTVHCTGWAFVIHRENGIEMLCVVVNQHIRTNATTALTQNSRCIAQLISLLGQVAKDEHALVAQDLVEVRNPLRQPGK